MTVYTDCNNQCSIDAYADWCASHPPCLVLLVESAPLVAQQESIYCCSSAMTQWYFHGIQQFVEFYLDFLCPHNVHCTTTAHWQLMYQAAVPLPLYDTTEWTSVQDFGMKPTDLKRQCPACCCCNIWLLQVWLVTHPFWSFFLCLPFCLCAWLST